MSAEPTPCVKLPRTPIRRGGRTILAQPDLTLSKAERIALMGPNGCGKSTLLRALAGRSKPTPTRFGSLAYLPQERPLEPHFTVREQLHALASLQRLDRGFVARALDEFSLSDLASRPIRALSEGQKQRVALAQCVSARPDLLLLDEPTTALDESSRRQLWQALDRPDDWNPGILFVTHSAAEAQRHARTLWLLGNGEMAVELIPAGLEAQLEVRFSRPLGKQESAALELADHAGSAVFRMNHQGNPEALIARIVAADLPLICAMPAALAERERIEARVR